MTIVLLQDPTEPDVVQFIKDQTQWSKLQVMMLMRIKQVIILLTLLPM